MKTLVPKKTLNKLIKATKEDEYSGMKLDYVCKTYVEPTDVQIKLIMKYKDDKTFDVYLTNTYNDGLVRWKGLKENDIFKAVNENLEGHFPIGKDWIKLEEATIVKNKEK